jgi:hypothetical protein
MSVSAQAGTPFDEVKAPMGLALFLERYAAFHNPTQF